VTLGEEEAPSWVLNERGERAVELCLGVFEKLGAQE